MTEELSLAFQANLPVSFRIFGSGDVLKQAIDKIKSWEFESVSAEIIDANNMPTPKDEDLMVILLVEDSKDLATSIGHSFYQAGVLTIMVSPSLLYADYKFCDTQTVCDIEKMYNVVKGILFPIFLNSYICVDFNDISYILRNLGFFKIIESVGIGNESRIADALSKIDKKLAKQEMESVERIILSIFFNKEMQPPLSIGEIQQISDFISNLPQEINVMWSIHPYEMIPKDEVWLSMIISGKELKI